MTKYNGWTNYATWRVNLEIFDGMSADYVGWRGMEYWELAPVLRECAEDIIEQTAPEGLARDWALAFLQDVNWREIAQHLLAANAE